MQIQEPSFSQTTISNIALRVSSNHLFDPFEFLQLQRCIKAFSLADAKNARTALREICTHLKFVQLGCIQDTVFISITKFEYAFECLHAGGLENLQET